LLLMGATPTVAAPSPHQPAVVFKLEPEYCSPDGHPSDIWQSQLAPGRDSFDDARRIQMLRRPSSVADNPVFSGVFKLTLDDSRDLKATLAKLRNLDGVLWAELDPIRYTCGIPREDHAGVDAPPNDPYFPLQWSLGKIAALPGWDISIGDSSVVIAIVDVGVDIDHNDLIQKRWKNYAELNGETGVDDDGNGFVDDSYGWDFYDDDSDPRPGGTDNHGTHVAGIAAAASDNNYGIAGVAWNCRIMPLRTGSGRSIYRGYEAVIYAAAMGADVINLSWGSNSPSNVERLTAEFAEDQGALLPATTPPPLQRRSITTPPVTQTCWQSQRPMRLTIWPP